MDVAKPNKERVSFSAGEGHVAKNMGVFRYAVACTLYRIRLQCISLQSEKSLNKVYASIPYI